MIKSSNPAAEININDLQKADKDESEIQKDEHNKGKPKSFVQKKTSKNLTRSTRTRLMGKMKTGKTDNNNNAVPCPELNVIQRKISLHLKPLKISLL